ncbi:MAG: hypothetical protein MJ206_01275 [Bacilli bacterium]|nr:hypothetical protein [Bacilli bacterium]
MKKKTILLSVAPILMAAASLTSCGGSHPDDPIKDVEPLCFTALHDDSSIYACFAVAEEGKVPEQLPIIYYYIGEQPSGNPKDWKQFEIDNPEYSEQLEEGYQKIATINKGQNIYFVGKNPNGINGPKAHADPLDATVYWHFGTDVYKKGNPHSFEISGNIMSLIDYTKSIEKIPGEYCFAYLFANRYYGAPQFVNASKLQLSATELTAGCYYNLFYNNSLLTDAEIELVAGTMEPYCYSGMFFGCEKLEKAPKTLKAMNLAEHCYEKMFCNCFNGLKNSPELLATDLKDGCYNYMFNNCHKLNNIVVHFDKSCDPDEMNKWASGKYSYNWLDVGGGAESKYPRTFTSPMSKDSITTRNDNTVPNDDVYSEWDIKEFQSE